MRGKNLGASNGMRKHHLHELLETTKGGTFKSHSPTEKEFVRELEQDGDVLEFHYEAIRVRYCDQRGIPRANFVDFLILRRTVGWELVEVKTPGELHLSTCRALLAVADFASKFGWLFYVWNGLTHLNITECTFGERSSSNNGANSGKPKSVEDRYGNPEPSREQSRACVETMGSGPLVGCEIVQA